MALPTLAAYTTPLSLPSDGREIRVRPWTVREEKIFLMANESEVVRDTLDAIEQVVFACTDGALDAKTVPAFDVEWTLLKMRCFSVGADTTVHFVCNNQIGEGESTAKCNAHVPVTIDLTTIAKPVPQPGAGRIVLNSELTLQLRYPTIFELDVLSVLEDNPVDGLDKLIILFESLTETETQTVHPFTADNADEVVQFFYSLTPVHVEQILTFLRDMPTISAEVPFECAACGNTATVPFRGLLDFFG